jgi:ankyrin repeat protein
MTKQKIIDNIFYSFVSFVYYILLILLKLNLNKYTQWDMIDAAKNGNYNLTKFILENTDIAANVEGHSAIMRAASNGFVDIVELLLQDKTVDPSFNSNSIIRIAHIREQKNVVELLWKNEVVKKTLKKDDDKIYNSLIKIEIQNKVNEF